MLEVDEALEVITKHTARLAPVVVSAGPLFLGRVLAETVVSDIDSPPFDKAMMDGYAVRAADCGGGTVELCVIGEVAAGTVPQMSVGPGEALAIYTGAPMPNGADAVVTKERTELLAGGRVRISDTALTPRKNVLDRGREMRAGGAVLPAETVLTPAAFGLLAALGKTSVSVYPLPRVGILATGNELVEAGVKPGVGQIRNSNGPMLAAQVAHAGGSPQLLGIARDDAERMRATIHDALAATDVLILAGGVSVGKYDLVPDVLTGSGAQIHFHKVRMKPGKPLLFGTLDHRLVFGLPGNPVSAFVCFELFVRPALRLLAGYADHGPTTTKLPMAESFASSNDRPTFHPAKVEYGEAGYRVRGLPWFGAADLRGLMAANAFLALPPGDVRFEVGHPCEVVLL